MVSILMMMKMMMMMSMTMILILPMLTGSGGPMSIQAYCSHVSLLL